MSENAERIKEVLHSEGWHIILHEIIIPLREEKLRALTQISLYNQTNPAIGCELAAQVRIIDKILEDVKDMLVEDGDAARE